MIDQKQKEYNENLANGLMTARALMAADDALRNLFNMGIETPETQTAHGSIKEHLQACLIVLTNQYGVSQDIIYYEV